jgi:hypothetical protein
VSQWLRTSSAGRTRLLAAGVEVPEGNNELFIFRREGGEWRIHRKRRRKPRGLLAFPGAAQLQLLRIDRIFPEELISGGGPPGFEEQELLEASAQGEPAGVAVVLRQPSSRYNAF